MAVRLPELRAALILGISPVLYIGISAWTWAWGSWSEYSRHPSYLGALLGAAGWFLVFRCGIGFLLGLLLIPLAVFWLPREEAMLLAEFDEEYAAYKRRTWRRLPFVY
jgi:protein-S-isoprenylcysteine O-methyltransferase Ste14